MIWMSYTAVSAVARGLVFTQSLFFLMAGSSDELEHMRVVAYSVLSSLGFRLKKCIYRHFVPLGEICIHKSHLHTQFSHYHSQNNKWANISMWVTCCAQREMTGQWKATKSACIIIIFIILVGKMTEASESSISFSTQRGFKLDILDRNSYIMSHVYIKHGFT